jgi:hypothetical protein
MSMHTLACGFLLICPPHCCPFLLVHLDHKAWRHVLRGHGHTQPCSLHPHTLSCASLTVHKFRYALNVQYNLYNKKILNVFDFPYTTALIQVR